MPRGVHEVPRGRQELPTNNTPNRTYNNDAKANKKIEDPIDLEQMRRDVERIGKGIYHG